MRTLIAGFAGESVKQEGTGEQDQDDSSAEMSLEKQPTISVDSTNQDNIIGPFYLSESIDESHPHSSRLTTSKKHTHFPLLTGVSTTNHPSSPQQGLLNFFDSFARDARGVAATLAPR